MLTNKIIQKMDTTEETTRFFNSIILQNKEQEKIDERLTKIICGTES